MVLILWAALKERGLSVHSVLVTEANEKPFKRFVNMCEGFSGFEKK
jgi:hypothetical protein